MAKPSTHVTPDGRVDRWKKLWATPKRLTTRETEEAFDAFADAFVPRHMHKRFLKTFGVPKASFGNRYFLEDASFRDWNLRVSSLVSQSVESIEAVVIYGSPDALEGHRLTGQVRRSFKEVFIDDWFGGCAIITGGSTTIYAFIEPKMRGVVIRTVRGDDEPELDAEPVFLEPDADDEEVVTPPSEE